MTGAVIMAAVTQSAGIGIGTALGTAFGLTLRKRAGKTEGLIGGNVALTALAAGLLALALSVVLRLSGAL
ncbi:hypothetical protein [Actibacterium sp. D379-3]